MFDTSAGSWQGEIVRDIGRTEGTIVILLQHAI